MTTIPFTKMQGAGNDFLIIEEPKKGPGLKKLATRMCERTTGVGADGLLVLGKSRKTDFKMRVINADGSEAEMCGNGARCLAAYIKKNRKTTKKTFGMETIAGIIMAEVSGNVAKVRLSDPLDYREDILVDLGGPTLNVSYIDTGVPHTVVFVDGLQNIDVNTIGRKVRAHDQFKPRGTNVNFVEETGKNCVALRTYERGVEAETKACGTGSVAAALVGFLRANPGLAKKKKAKMKVRTASTEVLEVTFDIEDGRISDVWLKGSAQFIAKGEYYV